MLCPIKSNKKSQADEGAGDWINAGMNERML